MFYPIGAYQICICIYLLAIQYNPVFQSLSLSFTLPSSLTHFLSEVHSLHANGQPPLLMSI